MKRKLIGLFLVAGVFAFMPLNAEAQGLGGLLKKGKKALEQIATPKEATATDTQTQNQSKSVRSVTLDNGIEVINPFAENITITPIGLYASSKSENYGDAVLVFKVQMNDPQNSCSFGGNVEQPMLAVDDNGKVYDTKAGIYDYDTPEGIPVRIVLDKYGHSFTGIKKNIELMPIVKFGIWLGSNRKGQVTLKNVPVLWDQSLD